MTFQARYYRLIKILLHFFEIIFTLFIKEYRTFYFSELKKHDFPKRMLKIGRLKKR